MEIECEITINPDTEETRAFYTNQIRFEIDEIGSSTLTWDNANGVAVYDSGAFKVKATFTGLPVNNSDFGNKEVRMIIDGGNNETRNIKIFYTATDTNHPGETSTDPNWFYYYKNEEGADDYSYDGSLSTSKSTAGVPNSIRIANNAYTGSYYIETRLVSERLKATGISSTIKYWKYFKGVLNHERFHVSNGANHGILLDPDEDDLITSFENDTVKSDPYDKYSIDGGIFGNTVWDDECWAGGPIEKEGIDSADTTKDWATPGSQWP